MSVISNSRQNLSTSQGNLAGTTNVPSTQLTLEKKAWFMCKILCRELNGFTFAQVRERLMQCKGVKTRVKLNHKGWRVGSKLDLNPKVQAEFIPIDCIDQILQDVQYVNVLFVILALNAEETEQNVNHLKYEIWTYKLKNQSSAFRFQDIFGRLTGVQANLPRSLSRSELSVNGLSMFPAKNYPMGALAVDRWGGRQGPRSEASYGYYGRNGGGMTAGGRNISASPYSVVPASSVQRTNMLRDDRMSEMESFDSGGDNRTTTYREVAVSANFANGASNANGRPVLRSETNKVYRGNNSNNNSNNSSNQRLVPNSSVSETWCQADYGDGGGDMNQQQQPEGWYRQEARAMVTPNHFNGHPSQQYNTNVHESLSSSIDDSGFYNGSEIAVAHTRGGRQNGIDVVDGTVSVRKVFNKKNAAGVNSSGTAYESGEFLRYPQESTSMLGRRTRSTDYLGPGNQNVSYGVGGLYGGRQTPVQGRFLQVPPPNQGPMIRGGSRPDLFNDNASIASQGSSYLLDPKFRKGYIRRDQRNFAGGQQMNYDVYGGNRSVTGRY